MGLFIKRPLQIFFVRSVMNYQEGSTMIESILPIAIGISLGCLACIGIREFWHEFEIAFKGGFQ